MIFYSAEARGYALMIAFCSRSTLALLSAVEDGRARWWVAYARASCAAMYTHYTCVFALAAQLLGCCGRTRGAPPRARSPRAAAAVAFLPWLSGLRGRPRLDDDRHPLGAAAVHRAAACARASIALGDRLPVRRGAARGCATCPGVPALILLAAGARRSGVGRPRASAARRRSARAEAALVLVLALAAAAPVGEALVSAVGSNVFGTRNLAASWPALALCLAALPGGAGRGSDRRRRAGGRRLRGRRREDARTALPAARLPTPSRRRSTASARPRRRRRRRREPQPRGRAHGAQRRAPAGAHPIVPTRRATRSATTRSGSSPPAPPPAEMIARAAAAARRRDGRLFLVLLDGPRRSREALDALPPGYAPCRDPHATRASNRLGWSTPPIRPRAARSRRGNAERRRTSSRSRTAGSSSEGSDAVWCRNISSKNSASPGSKIGRRIGDVARRLARLSHGSARRRASRRASMTISSSRRGTMSSPGATSPQRESDSQRLSARARRP